MRMWFSGKTSAFQADDTGSIPVLGIFLWKYGLLAQAVEHLTFNQGVAGSSPAWLMKNSIFNILKMLFLFFANDLLKFF